jgi:glycine/D-amino acid oxidase-like deaminating enzyme
MYDLIIIGGGMSGISVARAFHGRRVLLLERGRLLSGATGNNAGFVITGFGEHFNRTVRKYGLERAREIQQIHISNRHRVRELARGIDCDAKFEGGWSVALTQEERADLLESLEMMREAKFDVGWEEEQSAGLRSAGGCLVNLQDGTLNSVRFWSELARNVEARIFCEVQQVINRPDFIEVVTSAGSFQALRVVFCLNAFSARLVPELAGRYIPLRGQMLEMQLHGKPPGWQPVCAGYGDIYWRFTGTSLIFGGLEDRVPAEEVGIAGDVSPLVTDLQKEWVGENFRPGLVSGNLIRTWCSTMAFTVDGFPFVGPLPEHNRYVLSGLCGLGHGYALECAHWLYELIEHDRNTIPSYFSSARITGLPVYRGGDWRRLYEAWNH